MVSEGGEGFVSTALVVDGRDEEGVGALAAEELYTKMRGKDVVCSTGESKMRRRNGNYLCANECVGENVVEGDCDEAIAGDCDEVMAGDCDEVMAGDCDEAIAGDALGG
jgi:hypothetical protein